MPAYTYPLRISADERDRWMAAAQRMSDLLRMRISLAAYIRSAVEEKVERDKRSEEVKQAQEGV